MKKILMLSLLFSCSAMASENSNKNQIVTSEQRLEEVRSKCLKTQSDSSLFCLGFSVADNLHRQTKLNKK